MSVELSDRLLDQDVNNPPKPVSCFSKIENKKDAIKKVLSSLMLLTNLIIIPILLLYVKQSISDLSVQADDTRRLFNTLVSSIPDVIDLNSKVSGLSNKVILMSAIVDQFDNLNSNIDEKNFDLFVSNQLNFSKLNQFIVDTKKLSDIMEGYQNYILRMNQQLGNFTYLLTTTRSVGWVSPSLSCNITIKSGYIGCNFKALASNLIEVVYNAKELTVFSNGIYQFTIDVGKLSLELSEVSQKAISFNIIAYDVPGTSLVLMLPMTVLWISGRETIGGEYRFGSDATLCFRNLKLTTFSSGNCPIDLRYVVDPK